MKARGATWLAPAVPAMAVAMGVACAIGGGAAARGAEPAAATPLWSITEVTMRKMDAQPRDYYSFGPIIAPKETYLTVTVTYNKALDGAPEERFDAGTGGNRTSVRTWRLGLYSRSGFWLSEASGYVNLEAGARDGKSGLRTYYFFAPKVSYMTPEAYADLITSKKNPGYLPLPADAARVAAARGQVVPRMEAVYEALHSPTVIHEVYGYSLDEKGRAKLEKAQAEQERYSRGILDERVLTTEEARQLLLVRSGLFFSRLVTGPAQLGVPEGTSGNWLPPLAMRQEAVKVPGAATKPATAPVPATAPSIARSATTAASQPGATSVVRVGKYFTMRIALLPAGKFIMGPPKGEVNHEVTISKAFYMGVHEVTRMQYDLIMGKRAVGDEPDNAPVDFVTWPQANEFCQKLSQVTGRKVRLPTEAEWEYACRAGSATAFSSGDDKSTVSAYAWDPSVARGKGGRGIMPVGSKKPNAWGLYDMMGNVEEWCSDWYGPYTAGPATDPVGPVKGMERVYRSLRNDFQSGARGKDTGGEPTGGRGLRVVVE